MLILRGDLGDRTIALAAYLLAQNSVFTLVDVDTGWGSSKWAHRRSKVRQWLSEHGIEYITLRAPLGMAELIERRGMPSSKFSWCTSHLKGLPFNDYLDRVDPNGQATIVLPRVAAYLRYPFEERVANCPYHGDRALWHPLKEYSILQLQDLVEGTPIEWLGTGSLACAPCIYHSECTLSSLTEEDKQRLAKVEQAAGEVLVKIKKNDEHKFNTGCGDPFCCNS